LIAGLVLVLVVVLLLVRRRARRHRRDFSADVLRDALGQTKPYSGPSWKVGDQWL
jgi:hypothetical protein